MFSHLLDEYFPWQQVHVHVSSYFLNSHLVISVSLKLITSQTPNDTSISPLTLARNLASPLLLHIQSFNKVCLVYFLYVSKIHLNLYSPKTLQWHSISLRIKSELLKKADGILHSLTSAFFSSFKDPTLSLETESLQDFPLLGMLFLPLLLWLTPTGP